MCAHTATIIGVARGSLANERRGARRRGSAAGKLPAFHKLRRRVNQFSRGRRGQGVGLRKRSGKENSKIWQRHRNAELFRDEPARLDKTTNALFGLGRPLIRFVTRFVATRHRCGVDKNLYLTAERACRPKGQHNQRDNCFQPVHAR